MGIEELREEILEEAEKKVSEILSEAKSKAESIIKDAEKKAELLIIKKKESLTKSLREKEKSELAIARIEGKRMVHEKKWEIVDLSFQKALEKLKDYRNSDKYYEEILPKFILEGIHSLNLDKAVLMLNESDLKAFKNKLRHVEKQVSEKSGRNVKLVLDDQPIRIIGGVIVADADKNIFYNDSFDAKLVEARENFTADIMDILFG